MEQVAVARALLQLLQLSKVFFDNLWVVYIWHGPIVPLMRWIGIIHRVAEKDDLLGNSYTALRIVMR